MTRTFFAGMAGTSILAAIAFSAAIANSGTSSGHDEPAIRTKAPVAAAPRPATAAQPQRLAIAVPRPDRGHGETPGLAGAHADPLHWGYEGEGGPANWGRLSPDYGLCATGKMQSPVDLADANTIATVTVSTDYRSVPLTILNNGHTVQVNFPAGSTMTSSGKAWRLVQAHFHAPSEHVFNGKVYPLEAHFVHQDEQGRLAVLGVFFEEGPTNIELAKLIVAAPRQKAGPNPIEGFTFDPRALLPRSLSVFRYQGSLTTPPCSEGVSWHVAATTVQASATQIADLARVMGMNARPVQPVNNRVIKESR